MKNKRIRSEKAHIEKVDKLSSTVAIRCQHLSQFTHPSSRASPIYHCHCTGWVAHQQPWWQGVWGQHGTHLGTTGPRWAPCWPHELCYLGNTPGTTGPRLAPCWPHELCYLGNTPDVWYRGAHKTKRMKVDVFSEAASVVGALKQDVYKPFQNHWSTNQEK